MKIATLATLVALSATAALVWSFKINDGASYEI